jgi:hypothetical protein
MEDFQRAMRGSFFAVTAGAAGESAGVAEPESRPETGRVSSDGRRGVSPENTSSPACFASETGRSGAEAEERRAAAWERAARGEAGLVWGAGVFTERTVGIAGCKVTATDGGLIDGAIDGANDMDGVNGKIEMFDNGNEPLILGSDGTKFGTARD